MIAQAEAAGQAPMSIPRVQEYDRKIMEKQDELAQLQASPLDNSIKNAQNMPAQQPSETNKEQKQVFQVPPRDNYEPIQESPKKPGRETELPQYKSEGPLLTEPIAVPQIEIPQIGLTTILFPKFSTEISSEYDLYLNYVAKQMQENPTLILNIDAFTDNSEKNRVSMQITAGMANSVAQAMVNRGISPARLAVKANGSKKAVGDNGTFFGQARNRRVELSFGL